VGTWKKMTYSELREKPPIRYSITIRIILIVPIPDIPVPSLFPMPPPSRPVAVGLG
jgi:hypothetical protein